MCLLLGLRTDDLDNGLTACIITFWFPGALKRELYGGRLFSTVSEITLHFVYWVIKIMISLPLSEMEGLCPLQSSDLSIAFKDEWFSTFTRWRSLSWRTFFDFFFDPPQNLNKFGHLACSTSNVNIPVDVIKESVNELYFALFLLSRKVSVFRCICRSSLECRPNDYTFSCSLCSVFFFLTCINDHTKELVCSCE